MTNEEKAKEIAMPCQGCECEWTKEKMYKQQYCKDCVAQDKFIAAMQAMEWKDKVHAQEKQQWIDNACERLEYYFAPDGSMVPENIRLWRDLQRVIKGEQL